MTSIKKAVLFGSLPVLLLGCFLMLTLVYTTAQLAAAKASRGVFDTPEEGMRAIAEESWVDVERVEILRAGPNSRQGRNPHVWFVAAKVWAEGRSDGKPMPSFGYAAAGSFFLHTKEGWVHMSEGAFPGFVGFGMKVFGMIPDD